MNDVALTGFAAPSFVGFRHAEDMYASLAGEIVSRLAAGVARRGQASFVASGGTTSAGLYDALATRDAPWRDVWVTLSDERWTDPRAEYSNERRVRTRLLTGKAAAARLVPLKTAHAHASEAEAEAGAAVAAMPRPFEVVLLGMGTDLHIASLIPGADSLASALDRNDPAFVRALTPPDLATTGERMTLTLRTILDAHWIVLLIRGEAKLAAYKRALPGHDALAAPAGAVLQQSVVPVSVYWSE
jgi:6-phosphogluconolactonase